MMTRFSVKNYKCLADVSLPLTPLHVIIGQNDSGKTSLLEAMLALHQSVNAPLGNAFKQPWQGRELVFENSAEPRIEFAASFATSPEVPGPTYHLTVEFGPKGHTCIRTDEWIDAVEPMPVPPRGWGCTGLSERNQPEFAVSIKPELIAMADMIGEAKLYRLDPRTMAEPAALDANRKYRLDDDGFGLPTLLDDVLGYDPMLYLAISKEFCEFFPQFHRLRIETEMGSARQYSQGESPQPAGRKTGKGIYLETTHGRAIRAQQASDGAILFLGLLALMRSPNPPKLLLIEEPEKGVYPKRLAEVINLLRRLEAESANRPVPQIILTTHSPFLLSSFRPEEVTLLRRESDIGPVKAYPLREALRIEERMGNDEFYLGELWYNLSEEELLGRA